MSDKRTKIVGCPGCNGAGQWQYFIGYDRETGAPTSIPQPCDTCMGTGGVEVELEPITLDDLTAVSSANTGAPTNDR